MEVMNASTQRLVGIAGGVIALALLVALGVFLPKIDDGGDASSGSSESSVVLPDELPGGLVAIDSADLPEALSSQIAPREQVLAGQKASSEQVSSLFGTGAQLRVYATPDAQSLATVIVVDETPGPFLPDGPPAVEGAAAAAYDLVPVGDGVCAQYFTSPTDAQGQPVEGGQPVLGRSHCQVGSGDSTIDVTTQGLDEQAVTDLLAAL